MVRSKFQNSPLNGNDFRNDDEDRLYVHMHVYRFVTDPLHYSEWKNVRGSVPKYRAFLPLFNNNNNNKDYLDWTSLKSCKNGLMIRKFFLVKGMFSTKISLAKGIQPIARTLRQPNYPNQLAPKRGSQSSLMFDPNLMWWANGGNLSIVQAGRGHSQQGGLSAHCSRQPMIAPLITCS